MSKWLLQAKKADFKALSATLGVDQVTARVMVNRGLTTVEEMQEYLNPALNNLPSPFLFKDMEKACELLMDAIDEDVKIRVIGDYDVDGIMSTYILKETIIEAGGDCDYMVPNRVEDGYGVNPEMVRAAAKEGIGFIITCDNGIAAFEAAEEAKRLGMTFVITDHHEVPFDLIDGEKRFKLPPADAIVDPKQEDCAYPFKGICGAQVAWKLSYCLFEMLGIEPEEADRFMQYAAIACICDVMELKGENRSLVAAGLKEVAVTNNVGLHALLARNELIGKKITCYHIGFVIGPCLNASGRLDTALKAIDLLSEEDSAKALTMAEELVALNASRKNMTLTGLEKAKEIIEANNMVNDKVLVVYVPGLHESLAGIVAGRIKETYYRPTIVITDCENGSGAKGSARSIEAYNMFEELSKVKELFSKFGGHPMAAGISLPKENIEILRKRLNENTSLTEDDMQEIIRIDVPMPLYYISQPLVEELGRLEPFGTGNPKPLFAVKDITVVKAAFLGSEGKYLKLFLDKGNGDTIPALLFRGVEDFESLVKAKYGEDSYNGLFSGRRSDVKLDIVYEPSINEYRGNKSLQLTIERFQ